MKYQTTKKQCQEEINKLNKVCEYCGRKPVPIKTVDNDENPTYWIGCRHGGDWGNFIIGVDKEIYDLAKKLVLDDSCYLKMHKETKDFNHDFQASVRRACDILEEVERMKNGKPRYSKKDLARIYEYLEEGIEK